MLFMDANRRDADGFQHLPQNDNRLSITALITGTYKCSLTVGEGV